MPIDIPAGSDFENFQMKVAEKETGAEVAFQDYDTVFVTLVDDNSNTIAEYDTAGNTNPLNLIDTTGNGDKETLEVDIFGDDTLGKKEIKIYANIDVVYTSRPGYSGSPAYKRLFDSKHVINLKNRV